MSTPYNKEFICTYPYYDKKLRQYVFDNTFDEEDVKDFEDMSVDIYRAEILQVFGINAISDITNPLNNILNEYPQLNTLANDVLSSDPVLLFSYDYFFYTHQCIINDCSDDMILQLKTYISSNK